MTYWVEYEDDTGVIFREEFQTEKAYSETKEYVEKNYTLRACGQTGL